MSNSFRRDSREYPASYRTPSPPLRSREPISPLTPEFEQITPERLNGFEEEFTSNRRSRKSYTQHKQPFYHPERSSRNQLKPYGTSSRTSGHTRDWSGSYQLSSNKSYLADDRAREEAELLLNFTREARFSVPKTPLLSNSSQHRSASFASFGQARPSLSELLNTSQLRQVSSPRPVTQSGTKSIWKEDVFSKEDTPRQIPPGVLDRLRYTLPPPTSFTTQSSKPDSSVVKAEEAISGTEAAEVQDDADSRPTPAVAELEEESKSTDSQTLAETKTISSHIEESAVDEIPTPNEETPPDIAVEPAGAAEVPEVIPAPVPGGTAKAPEVKTTTTLNKKKDDTPTTCASCNFARNVNENEAGSDTTSWIGCDGCKSWFHFACAGFQSEREVRTVDKFRCKNCKPIHGATTFVRKSSRAHTSIDYAGLNEGVVKTSDLDPEHHYVKDFKNGKQFTPENFIRLRPELVTAEFFERGEGMKEPVVIPASLNPRPSPIPTAELPEEAEDFDEQADKTDVLHNREKLDDWLAESFEYDIVQDQGQDALDMVIPRDLTVRKVAELYGPYEKLEVINVKSQNGEDKPWTLQRWADYYESTGEKVVRNVISLEVSYSKLGRLIRRPKVVRQLDLQDSVWPAELQAKGEYPKVQFYCLMSVADCYTDFHIDFGGSSVYYHILKGHKTFFFIPPTEKHLKQYEDWCNSPAQNWTFLGDQVNQCYRVDLTEGDTMLIPAGWIHAVWTPSDSLVIGGNFLTRLHYPLQIRVAQIEKATNVARKFRYPHFQKLLWFTAIRYMDEDPIPESVMETLNAGQVFPRQAPSAEDFDTWGEHSLDLEENYHARFYPRPELDGLPALCEYLWRTAQIATGHLTDGITADTRNAVKRSVPKGHNHGEPLEAIKKFALWCAWKRGNETIPYWAYANYVPESTSEDGAEKKLSTKQRRRLDSEAAKQAIKVAPERQSARAKAQPQNYFAESVINQDASISSKTRESSIDSTNSAKRKLEDTPINGNHKVKKARLSMSSKTGSGRKTACEACRKSRRACKHGANADPEPLGGSLLLADTSMASFDTPSKEASKTDSSVVYDSITLGSRDGQLKTETNGDSMMMDAPLSLPPPGPDTLIARSQTKPGGRSKACKDCRKSKRRCVHDEFGNEDPKRLAENPIPRPAAKKRKPLQSDSLQNVLDQSNGSLGTPTYTAPRAPMAPMAPMAPRAPMASMHSNISYARPPTEPSSQNAPVQPQQDVQMTGMQDQQRDHNLYDPAPYEMTMEDMAHTDRDYVQSYEDQDVSMIDPALRDAQPSGMDYDFNSMIDPALMIDPSLIDPALMAGSQQDAINLAIAQSAEKVMSMINTAPQQQQQYEPAAHESEEPVMSKSMVSPPDSTDHDLRNSPAVDPTQQDLQDSSAIETAVQDLTPPPTTSDSSRHSSRPIAPPKATRATARATPDSSTLRQPSLSSGAADSTRDSASPAIELPGNSMTSRNSTTPLKRSKSRAASEFEGDEASLKLIREMQKQDMGLRRRRS